MQRKEPAHQTAGATAAADSLVVSGDAELTAAKLDLLHTPRDTEQAASDEQLKGPGNGQTDAQSEAPVDGEVQRQANDRPSPRPVRTPPGQRPVAGGAISNDEVEISAGEISPAIVRPGADHDEAASGGGEAPSGQGTHTHTLSPSGKPLVLKQGVAALDARESFKAALKAASLAEAAGAAESSGWRTPRSRNGSGNVTPRCGGSWAGPPRAFGHDLMKPGQKLFHKPGWTGRLPAPVGISMCGAISM